jgi:hypothetical protein
MINASSDKTVRLFRWEAGSGFVEDKNSPFLGHKYAVTKAEFSPKVKNLLIYTPSLILLISTYAHYRICSLTITKKNSNMY